MRDVAPHIILQKPNASHPAQHRRPSNRRAHKTQLIGAPLAWRCQVQNGQQQSKAPVALHASAAQVGTCQASTRLAACSASSARSHARAAQDHRGQTRVCSAGLPRSETDRSPLQAGIFHHSGGPTCKCSWNVQAASLPAVQIADSLTSRRSSSAAWGGQ